MKKGSKYTREQLEKRRKLHREHPPHLGIKHSEEARHNISLSLQKEKHPMWGKKFSLERRQKISNALKGRSFSKTHRDNLRITHLEILKGKKNPNWKGGITKVNLKIKTSSRYRQWRKTVYERDNYTCQICGAKGVYLNADHIKPFIHYPDLRFELSNGRTLCVSCHRKTATFAGRVWKYDKNLGNK